MKVILSQNIASLGTMGDIVNVKNGYARNYLLPRGFAFISSDRNKANLDHQLGVIERRKAKVLAQAKTVAAQIEKTSVTVTKPVGENERIFGSVTAAELEELLTQEGIKISKKDINILEDIKKVGVYSAEVKLHPEVSAKFKVWVVAQ